jgi:hypothetical protein
LDANGQKQLRQHGIGRIAGLGESMVLTEVANVAPVLANDHQFGIKIPLPSGPWTDLVRVILAAINR